MSFGEPPVVPVRQNLPGISSSFNTTEQEAIYRQVLFSEKRYQQSRGVRPRADGSVVRTKDWNPEYGMPVIDTVNFSGRQYPTFIDVRPTETPLKRNFEPTIPKYKNDWATTLDKETVLKMLDDNRRSFDRTADKFCFFSERHMFAKMKSIINRSQSEADLPSRGKSNK